MYLSASAKLVPNTEVRLLDCIAEGISSDDAVHRINEFRPDVVLAIMAIEYFDNDVMFLQRLKRELPMALIGCFGHLPGNFQRETLDAAKCDFVLVGEPDQSFKQLLERRAAGGETAGDGVACYAEGSDFIPAEFQRIEDIDVLPYADQDAIDHSLYSEPFFGKPYTVFQSSRGCPFPCSYCVRSYGRKLVMASAVHVVGEVEAAVRDHGIRYFRFMDDTFTASRKRVLKICDGLAKLNLDISWSCLTRPNTIDAEVAAALKKAGCKRVYVGIESGSQKVLDYLNRGYKLDAVMDNLRAVRASGLEMVGWFIVGSPAEEREDFEASLQLARDLKLEFVAVSTLVPYPATDLYEREQTDIEFSLLPYRCVFTEQPGTELESEFYKRYYMTPSFIVGKMGYLAKHPGQSAKGAKEFLQYVVTSRRNPDRKDLL